MIISRYSDIIYSKRENQNAINIQTGEILEGELPRKALEMVQEWNSIHKEKLLKIWDTQEFIALSPLE